MEEHVQVMERLIRETASALTGITAEELKTKPRPDKWSRQEILGHLIDSAVNNLQRFTECQVADKPFVVRNYDQDLLVKSNGYQTADSRALLDFWTSINRRIAAVMLLKTDRDLAQEVLLPMGGVKDLRFLMTDYIEHMKYHLKQITGIDYASAFDTSNYL